MIADVGAHPAPRVMVLAPNWLGDVIMACPLLTRLSGCRTVGDGRPLQVILAVQSAWAPLFSGDPRLREIVPLERFGRHRGLAGLWRQGRDLGQAGCAAVVVGPPSLRAALACRLAGIPVRVGFAGDGRGPLLTLRAPGGRRGQDHFSRQMSALGEVLLTALDGIRTGPEGDGGAEADLLPGCRALAPWPIGGGPPLWAVGLGATYGPAKTWPVSRVADLLEEAVMARGCRVVLLGGPEAVGFAAAVRARGGLQWREDFPGGAGVVDRTGRTSLPQAVMILRAGAAFLGNDSGLMHLAGALGVPTVGVFGSTNPAWTSPLGPWTAAVFPEGFACRPCHRTTCNQAVFCLETLDAAQVVARLDVLLARRAAAEART